MHHIDGTTQAPPPVPVFPSNCPLTDDEEEWLEKAEKCHDDYDQWEAIIKAQIFTSILDSLLIEVQKLKMAKEVWEAMCVEHEKKALNMMVDIHCRIYKLKCEDESQVQTHLETLAKMQEQLAGMCAGLPNNDFVMVILRLGSLPKSYRPLINVISMSATHVKVSLEPDKVIESLLDEFEWLGIEERQLKASDTGNYDYEKLTGHLNPVKILNLQKHLQSANILYN